MNKTLIIVCAISLSLLIFSSAIPANAAFFSGKDLIAPDSSFSFLQIWKESIQTFFTFGLENKAKQYLHLADVRLNEYKNMIEKGKTEIAQKILDKYEKQLNQALSKAEELKSKGEDVKGLSQKIEGTVSKHLEVLQENLQKVPEQAKKGLENAIENSRKSAENVLGKKIEKEDETTDWKTYRNEEYGFEMKYPTLYSVSETRKGMYLVYLKRTNADASIGLKAEDINFDLQKIKQQFVPTGNESLPEKIIAGNNTFYYYGAGGGGVNYPDNYFYNLNGKVLLIQFDGPYINDKIPSQDTKALEPQILSTFKFTK